MDTLTLMRGLTEDHPSSGDEDRGETTRRRKTVPHISFRQPQYQAQPRSVPRGPNMADDLHGLIRGITEDHPSSSPSDDDGGGKSADYRRIAFSGSGSASGSAPPSATLRHRGSSSAASRLDKNGMPRDPHDLIRGMTEDPWSSDDEPQSRPLAPTLKKTITAPALPIHRLSSLTQADKPVGGDPHDLIRSMTEDVWTSSEDEAGGNKNGGAAGRKLSNGSGNGSKGSVFQKPSSPTTVVAASPTTRSRIPKSPHKVTARAASPAYLNLIPSTSDQPPVRVLFVCLGNICRSPMAHGVLQYLTRPGTLPPSAPPVRIDSAGTGAYHALSPPDARTMELLRMHNIKGFIHSARKIRAQDFYEFDYILCMDAENLADLKRRRKVLADRAGAARAASATAGACHERTTSTGSASGTGLASLSPTAASPTAAPKERRASSVARSRGEPSARIQLFGEYGGNQTEIVEDPYYGSNEGFDVAWEQCVRMARGWIESVLGVQADTSDLLG